ncbi:hypothetical protein M885DRAFT_531272 [Pelagophyceae sp. CCMP2097]|nr:hypothetical protein M885DRAFT_531272 [Pelagophyceae sp. CCMP2097]
MMLSRLGRRALGSVEALARARPSAARRSYYGEALKEECGGDTGIACSTDPVVFDKAVAAWALPVTANPAQPDEAPPPRARRRANADVAAAADVFAAATASADLAAGAPAAAPDQSAALLRRLVQSGALQYSEVGDKPEESLAAQRLVACVVGAADDAAAGNCFADAGLPKATPPREVS